MGRRRVPASLPPPHGAFRVRPSSSTPRGRPLGPSAKASARLLVAVAGARSSARRETVREATKFALLPRLGKKTPAHAVH
jgi:hypothetical protein